MTVSSTLNRKSYTGNGVTTSFGTSPFVFFATADLLVYVIVTATGVATLLTENTHYTVSGGSGLVGTVSLAGGSSPYGAPSALQTLLIVRDVAITQTTDFVNNDASDAEVSEDALDRLTMIAQQLDVRLDRSFVLSDSDVSGASTTIPTPVASTVVGWNSTGTALQNYSAVQLGLALTTPYTLTLLDDTTAAAARTTLGAASTVVTTKGDLYVGGAAGAEARKAVGTNGKVLIADSSQTDGLLYAPKAFLPGGRLTLTTAVPALQTDVAAATTVFYTPYIHDVIELYDGAGWIPSQFTELSQLTTDATKSPAAATTNSNYDYFVWNDAGTFRCTRGPLWSSATARGTGAGTTELELFEGRWVNKAAITNGPVARKGRYVGSVRTNGSSQIDFKFGAAGTAPVVGVWNAFNQVRVDVNVGDTTDSWTYTLATWRQANGSAVNQCTYIQGLSDHEIVAEVTNISNHSAGGTLAAGGVGVDVTNANSAQQFGIVTATTSQWHLAKYSGYPGIGFHTIARLEVSDASGTQTWRGDAGSAFVQTGMRLSMLA